MKIILVVLSLFSLATQAKTELTLKSQVAMSPSLPTLLEDLIESSNGVPAELLDIPLFSVRQSATKSQMLEWFKAIKNQHREIRSFVFVVPERINFEQSEVSARKILQARLQNRLKVKCSTCTFNVRITNLPTMIQAGSRIDYRNLPLSGPFMLNVVNSEGDTSSWLSGQIQTQRPIIRASRFLRAGESLKESDLSVQSSDITYLKDYYTEKKDLIGKRLNRAVSAHVVLSSQEIAREVDVKQGQTVKAKSGTENFEVVIQAIALDSGAIGDVIRVRNPNYQKMMSARIIEPGLVEIQ